MSKRIALSFNNNSKGMYPLSCMLQRCHAPQVWCEITQSIRYTLWKGFVCVKTNLQWWSSFPKRAHGQSWAECENAPIVWACIGSPPPAPDSFFHYLWVSSVQCSQWVVCFPAKSPGPQRAVLAPHPLLNAAADPQNLMWPRVLVFSTQCQTLSLVILLRLAISF